MKTRKFSVTPFEGLGEAIERKRKERASALRGPKSEEDLFLDAMSDVKEISEFREIQPKSPPGRKPSVTVRDCGLEALKEIVEGRRKIVLSDTDEYMDWVSPGMRKDMALRLHGGEFAVQDFIDLHGMTREEAEEELSLFVKDSIIKHLSCIKVIHGRGLRSPQGPVIKQSVEKWLKGRLSKHVAAFATARGCDSGLGATYVLLKRPKVFAHGFQKSRKSAGRL